MLGIVYGTDENNWADSITIYSTTTYADTAINIPLLFKWSNDSASFWMYSWDEMDNRSPKSTIDTLIRTWSVAYSDTGDTATSAIDYGILHRYPGGLADSVANMQDSSIVDSMRIYYEDIVLSNDSLYFYFPDTNSVDTSWYGVRLTVDGVRQDTIWNWYMFPEYVAADDCGSYTILCENAEGAGYDNDNGITPVEEGSVDEDYTGIVLRGSQSIQVDNSGGGTDRVHFEFTDKD